MKQRRTLQKTAKSKKIPETDRIASKDEVESLIRGMGSSASEASASQPQKSSQRAQETPRTLDQDEGNQESRPSRTLIPRGRSDQKPPKSHPKQRSQRDAEPSVYSLTEELNEIRKSASLQGYQNARSASPEPSNVYRTEPPSRDPDATSTTPKDSSAQKPTDHGFAAVFERNLTTDDLEQQHTPKSLSFEEEIIEGDKLEGREADHAVDNRDLDGQDTLDYNSHAADGELDPASDIGEDTLPPNDDVREYKERAAREKRQKLRGDELLYQRDVGIKALGQTVDALILRNPNKMFTSRADEPLIERDQPSKPFDLQNVVGHAQEASAAQPQSELFRNIEELRPSDTTVLRRSQFEELQQALLDGFTTAQLRAYMQAFPKENVEDIAPYAWVTEQVDSLHSEQNPEMSRSVKSSFVLRIMLRAWHLETQDEYEKVGSMRFQLRQDAWWLLNRKQTRPDNLIYSS